MAPRPSKKQKISHCCSWLLYLVVGQLLVYSCVIDVNAQPTRIEGQAVEETTPSALVNHPQRKDFDIDYQNIGSGELYLQSESGTQQALLLTSDYQVDVTALMARINLTQTFSNQSDEWVEGRYVFPLTEGVAVDKMKMIIGERVIVSEIKERNKAKQMYRQAKKNGKKAALLEQERPNLFTTTVANIPPKESITIQISYLTPVPLTDHVFSLRLPLTITPRYIPLPVNDPYQTKMTEQISAQIESELIIKDNQKITATDDFGWSVNTVDVPDANRITPRQQATSQGQQASITVTLNTGLPLDHVKSLYHPINHVEQKISLTKGQIAMDRDFVLQWTIKDEHLPKAAFFTETRDNYQYGFVLLNPPKLPILGHNLAKEMIYIIDTSGSMGGIAIRQAKRALAFAVNQLSVNDIFNVIAFNSEHSELFSRAKKANRGNVSTALNWINKLRASGGTEMLPALDLALDNTDSRGYLKQVVFITDGSVGNENQLFQLIRTKLGKARLHTVGIGSAPNSHFMELAAEHGRGSYSYIGDVSDVNQQMSELFNRISQPLLTDVEVQWPTPNVELLPNKIPDLYAGQPLIISARWPLSRNSTSNKIQVNGQLSNQTWQQSLLSEQAKPMSGVATWWARLKLKYLGYQLLELSDETERSQLVRQITEFAIQQNLLTKYTSFVAVEQQASRKVAQHLRKQSLANAMPKGSQQVIPFAKTSTIASRQFKVGMLLLSLLACGYVFRMLLNLYQQHARVIRRKR
jgi:Ca-activated chloride channel family protein